MGSRQKKATGGLSYLWLEGETVNPSSPNQYNGMQSVFFILVAYMSIVFIPFLYLRLFLFPQDSLGGDLFTFFLPGFIRIFSKHITNNSI